MTTAVRPPVGGPPPDGSWPTPPEPTPPPRKKRRGYFWALIVCTAVVSILGLVFVLVVANSTGSTTGARMNTASAPAAQPTVATPPPESTVPVITTPPPTAAAAPQSTAATCLAMYGNQPGAPARPGLGDTTVSWLQFVNYFIADAPASAGNFDARGYTGAIQTGPCVVLAPNTALAPRTEIMPDMSYEAHFVRVPLTGGALAGGPGDPVRFWTGNLSRTTIHTVNSEPDTYTDNVPTSVRLELYQFADGTTTVFAKTCPSGQRRC